MPSTTYKFNRAKELANSLKSFTKAHPKWRFMDRYTLYGELRVFGFEWDTDKQSWEPRTTLSVEGERPLRAIKRNNLRLPGTFLLRIMAPKHEIQQIEQELLELAEALGWNVDAGNAKEYPNDAGQWVRRYYRVVRG